MNTTDELRDRLLDMPVRGVSLQLWQEELALPLCGPLLANTLSHLELWPASAGISEDIMRRSKSRRWGGAEDVDLSEFKTIEHLSVDSSGRLTSGNLRSRLGNFCCNTNSNYIYFEHAPDLLTLETVIEAIAKWVGVIIPRFGFSDIQPKYTSLQYHMGTPGPSYGEAYQARIKAHEYARHNDPAGNALLRGHLLDVFEMNILSPAHLSHRVFGTKLSDWIGKGQRGELRELKKDVFAWFVPDDIRPDVRANLLRGKYLIVPV